MKNFSDYVNENKQVTTESSFDALKTEIYNKVMKYVHNTVEETMDEIEDDLNANVIHSRFKEYDIDWCNDEIDDKMRMQIINNITSYMMKELFKYYKK